MNVSEASVAATIMVGGLIIWMLMHRERRPRYRPKPLLTGCDREFYQRLTQTLPQCLIFPQISMSALIEPAGIGPARQAALALIEARRVGYAVFDHEMHLLTVVELDHRSRRTKLEVACEAYLASAGIKTVRFNVQQLPSEAAIRRRILASQIAGIRQRGVSHAGQRVPDIEFKRPTSPWRNTANIHT